MAKSKTENLSKESMKTDTVNSQVVDGVTLLPDIQAQFAKNAYELMQLNVENQRALQQAIQESLTLASDAYKAYYGSMNGWMQHGWATYSAIWNDPWGLSKGK